MKYEDYERRYDDYEFSGHGILREEAFGIYDMSAKEHMLLLERGKYKFNPAELIFRTEHVPYDVRCVVKNDLFEYVIDFYNATIEKINLQQAVAKKDGKKLYVLLGALSSTVHIAIDWDTKEHVYLYGYKTYRYSVYISPKYPASSSEIIRDDNVFVYLLPGKFENLFLLNTGRFWHSHKSVDDIWEPRTMKIPDKKTSDFLRNGKLASIGVETYIEAVKLLNKSRTKNLGRDGDFAYLEQAVAQLEDAIKKGKNPALIQFEGRVLLDALFRFRHYPICK